MSTSQFSIRANSSAGQKFWDKRLSVGYTVVQLIESLHCKLEGCRFDS
jgi:hypothetical protein